MGRSAHRVAGLDRPELDVPMVASPESASGYLNRESPHEIREWRMARSPPGRAEQSPIGHLRGVLVLGRDMSGT